MTARPIVGLPERLARTACPSESADPTRRLIETAFAIIASRITKAGHLAQVVPQEHRGNCSHKACTDACVEAGTWIEDADRWLAAHADAGPGRLAGEARTG